MAVLFEDLFAGTAGASITARNSNSGGSWEKHDSFPAADVLTNGSGTAYGNATIVMLTHNLAVGDCRIEANFNIRSQGEAYAGLILRASKSANSWQMLGINDGSGRPFFGYDTLFGSYTSEASTSLKSYYPNGVHALKFSVEGTGESALYRGWINKREVYRWAGGLADSGRCGIVAGSTASSTTGNHFDSFLLTTDAETRNQLQFIGDSMTWGAYNTPTQTLNVGWDVQWPADVAARLYADGLDFDWANCGASGKTGADMFLTRTADVSPNRTGLAHTAPGSSAVGWGWLRCHRPGAAKNIYVLMLGINDIVSAGQGAAGAYATITDCVAAIHAVGGIAIVLTNPMLLEGTHATFTVPAGTNAKLAALNDLIIANAAGADFVVNYSADPSVGAYNATFRAEDDGVHWLANAQPIVADYVYPAVAAAMTGGTSSQTAYFALNFGDD